MFATASYRRRNNGAVKQTKTEEAREVQTVGDKLALRWANER